MVALLLTALQILLLLLKAHFSKDTDNNQALKHIGEAQAKLNEIAQALEGRVRYLAPPPSEIDQLQDFMDRERKNHDLTSHR